MSHNITSTPRSRGKQDPFRKFFLRLALTFLAVMAGMSALNTWVNPLWLTPLPWSSAAFDDYKPIHKLPRAGKAGLVRSFDWDAVLLGSSRVDIALDPLAPEWHGLRVANLALRGGTLCENSAMLEYAARHENLQLAIVGVDLADLTSPVNIPVGGGFEESPLAGAGERFERELRYICGVSTLIETVKCLNYRIHRRSAEYTAQGHWARQWNKRPMREVMRSESFIWADRYISQRKQSCAVNPAKVAALHDIIRSARDHNIRLILCIPPSHAAYLTVFRLKGDPDPDFLADRATITRVVAEEAAAHSAAPPVDVWDFNDFHPLNCESPPPLTSASQSSAHWTDGTHALPSLGHVMLARMLGWPAGDPAAASYGERLDTASLAARISHIRDGYQRYQRDHPDDFQWVRENMDRHESSDEEAGQGGD